MNKTLKIIFVVLVVLAAFGLVFFIVSNSGDGSVATASTDEYNEKVEISFKNNKIDTVIVTFTCEDTDYLETLKTGIYFALGLSVEPDEIESVLSELDVEQSGNTLKIELSAKEYSLILGTDIDRMSKKEVKTALEDNGYKVK